MADDVDIANEIAARDLNIALAAARRKSTTSTTLAEQTGPRACADCGEGISPARLAAAPGAVRCIGCQREFELSATTKGRC